MTTEIPVPYFWLVAEPAPRMLLEALALYGTIEVPGRGSNPVITGWAHECNIGAYSTDEIPWCGLFQAVCAKRAGWGLPVNPLWALNWASWGQERIGGPLLGDVMVFTRRGGGHVAQYVGENKTHYFLLGGNQSDRVSVAPRARTSGLVAVRHAPWRVAQPESVRRIVLTTTGSLAPVKES